MDVNDYRRMKSAVLVALAKAGDEQAGQELDRREGAGVEQTQRAVRARRRAPRLIGWQRPLATARYPWWNPQVSPATYELEQKARAFYREQNGR